MKKYYIIIIYTFCCNILFAQNEDCRTKINIRHDSLIIKNKNCATKYLIEREGFPDIITSKVETNHEIVIKLAFCGVLSVKPITNCECSCSYKAVIINNHCSTTPVFITDMLLQGNKFYFTVQEMSDVHEFIIEVSRDGILFYPIKIIMSEEIKIGQQYYVPINF